MSRALRLSLAALVCAALAACSSTPAADLTAPTVQKRQLDAKTQLETGRRY